MQFGSCEDHAAAPSMWHPGNSPDLSGWFPLEVEHQLRRAVYDFNVGSCKLL